MHIHILLERFCEYSRSIRGYSPQTIKRYRRVTQFYCRYNKISSIEEVNEKQVYSFFYSGRIDRKWSANTFRIYHKTLLVFFRWCVKEGFMAENPVKNVELPKLERKLPVKLSKQNALRILEVAYNYPYDYKFLRYRNHAIFAVFIYAGLRKQELLNLKLADVDLENGTLFVRQGKGARDRIVPIHFSLVQILERYLSERKRLHKTCPEFFTSLRGNIPYTDNGLKRLIVQIRDASKISFSAHKLRHTFATLMLEGGCDIYSLSRIMGHSDIKTTTIYLHASTEHLRDQIIKHSLR